VLQEASVLEAEMWLLEQSYEVSPADVGTGDEFGTVSDPTTSSPLLAPAPSRTAAPAGRDSGLL
jgi:hypothetical protein